MSSSTLVEGCALCQLRPMSEGGQVGQSGVLLAYVDDQLLGLVANDRPGVLVAPRAHAGVPFDAPARSAVLLAGLRRVAEGAKAAYGVAEVAIEPVTDIPDAKGHVCYHLRPVLPAGESPAPSDRDARVRWLADTLRRHAAARRREHPSSGIEAGDLP
ncbi:MAG: hypothetical protein J2P57_01205 [Acidimicrobiaceae bacterium]|nr:hypothetical protein [Acidimicrobiaceae bacterium]